MAAKYILGALAILFLIAGISRRGQIQGPTWLLVAVIFGAVSGWLFFSAP